MSSLPRSAGRRRVSQLWHDYSLSLVVGALFALSFLLQAIFGWWQYAAGAGGGRAARAPAPRVGGAR